jgi:hypothetical protein
VTGLQTNLQRTTVSAISCNDFDLDAIHGNLPIARAHFPIRYLGLPLSSRRLRKIDFQPQIDKAASKLSTWYGRNLTQAGRVCLTKAVLSSQPVYLLTVIKPRKEVLEDIDNIRRCFLWAGDKALSGGKCKVDWTKTTLIKEYGGLGVIYLVKFATTLRVRWLWQEWTSPDKTWVGMEVPCTEKDKTVCTGACIGPAKRPPGRFWHFLGCTGRRQKQRDGCVRLRRRQIRRRPVRPGRAWTRGRGSGPTHPRAIPNHPSRGRPPQTPEVGERTESEVGERAATEAGERTTPTRAAEQGKGR